MKGIVFNLLEEVVRSNYGEETWDQLLEEAQLDGVYTSLGNYQDEEMMKIVEVASATLKIPVNDIIRWFGCNALHLLAKKYPHFFEEHDSTLPFLLTLNNVIHAEVKKIYPGAQVPNFDFDTSDPGFLHMGYVSPRKLCALAHGFIEGAAAYYREDVTIEQTKCLHRGDERCVFKLSFKK